MPPYSKSYSVRWSDVDPNGHVRHSSFLDYATATRMFYLADHGFTPGDFAAAQLGPVLTEEHLRYIKEVRNADTVTVDFTVEGLSPDGAHFIMLNSIYRGDGKLAVVVTVEGGWLDLAKRKLTRPPDKLRTLMEALPHTDAFHELEGLGHWP